jgi:hypothetical protein
MIVGRFLGVVIALIGAAATAIAALANPLGIGEDEVFGWLQITAVIVGGSRDAVRARAGDAVGARPAPDDDGRDVGSEHDGCDRQARPYA